MPVESDTPSHPHTTLHRDQDREVGIAPATTLLLVTLNFRLGSRHVGPGQMREMVFLERAGAPYWHSAVFRALHAQITGSRQSDVKNFILLRMKHLLVCFV